MKSSPNYAPQRTRVRAAGGRSRLSFETLGPAGHGGRFRFRVAVVFIAGLLAVELVGAGNQLSRPRPTARVIERYLAKPGDFTIVCTLFKGDPPGRVFLADIPITYDPMFLIGARVEEVTFETSPWKPGTLIRFAIHSPTLLLGGYQFDGQRYSMTFSPFRPHGKDDEIWFKPETLYLLKWIERLSEGQRRGRA